MIIKLTKNWAIETIAFTEAFPCVFDFGINLNTRSQVPFAHGFQIHLVLNGYTIFDVAIFNDEMELRE